MAYELPKCFVDKIEVDKKLQDLRKSFVASSIQDWIMFKIQYNELKALQAMYRYQCQFNLATMKPTDSDRPTQMAIAG